MDHFEQNNKWTVTNSVCSDSQPCSTLWDSYTYWQCPSTQPAKGNLTNKTDNVCIILHCGVFT